MAFARALTGLRHVRGVSARRVVRNTSAPKATKFSFAMFSDPKRHFGAARQPQEPKNPGAPAGVNPDEVEQGTGKRWEEVVAEEQNIVRFSQEGLYGPFGTLKAPVLVPSGLESRVVGCVGGDGVNYSRHHLLWMTIFEGKPHMCPECGQVFKLQQVSEDHESLQ